MSLELVGVEVGLPQNAGGWCQRQPLAARSHIACSQHVGQNLVHTSFRQCTASLSILSFIPHDIRCFQVMAPSSDCNALGGTVLRWHVHKGSHSDAPRFLAACRAEPLSHQPLAVCGQVLESQSYPRCLRLSSAPSFELGVAVLRWQDFQEESLFRCTSKLCGM